MTYSLMFPYGDPGWTVNLKHTQGTPIYDAEILNKMICSEIPELFNIVKQFQVHGPCGKQNMNSPCMNPEKKLCTNQYPKLFCSETTYNSENYPELRRRNDGKKKSFFIKKDGSIKCIADNLIFTN